MLFWLGKLGEPPNPRIFPGSSRSRSPWGLDGLRPLLLLSPLHYTKHPLPTSTRRNSRRPDYPQSRTTPHYRFGPTRIVHQVSSSHVLLPLRPPSLPDSNHVYLHGYEADHCTPESPFQVRDRVFVERNQVARHSTIFCQDSLAATDHSSNVFVLFDQCRRFDAFHRDDLEELR